MRKPKANLGSHSDKSEVLSPSEFTQLLRSLREEGHHVAAVDIVGPCGYVVTVVKARPAMPRRRRPVQFEFEFVA